MSVHLLDHVMDTPEEVFAALMVARELLCQSDERLVVDIERCGLKLRKAELRKNSPEVHYVLSGLHGRVS